MTISTADPAELLTRATRTLDGLVGRESIKAAVDELRRTVEEASDDETQPKNLVFTGPLGTGKSLVAQIVADIYAGTGVIESPTVHSVSERDLAGRYWDDPLAKVDEAVNAALGGILYIDEASRICIGATGGVDSSGPAVLDALLDAMHTHSRQLVVILAGYNDEMTPFLAGDERLTTVFPASLEFESYTAADIADITAVIAAREGDRITAKAKTAIRVAVQTKIDRATPRKYPIIDRFANARLSNQIYRRSTERRTHRLATMEAADITRAATRTLDITDVQPATVKILSMRH
ncbi:AAA family ATPase [Rhodococcus qingshengii]|uniref:AAA family ATPase n=1 Tax=Rhodococcus qingshengii TaxID=334542 RepID=UPI001A3815E4|nr:AAA family ATPase [Rhodococcus qingshengii]ULD38905.1 AAA family ATPase [Rhodococcus qingshengii]